MINLTMEYGALTFTTASASTRLSYRMLWPHALQILNHSHMSRNGSLLDQYTFNTYLSLDTISWIQPYASVASSTFPSQ